MDLGGMTSHLAALPVHEHAGTHGLPAASTRISPFHLGNFANTLSPSQGSSGYGEPVSSPPASAPLSYRTALTGVAPPLSHPIPPPSHPAQPPSHPVPSPQDMPTASLTIAEVKVFQGMAARVEALERELRKVSLGLLSSSRGYRELQDETTDIYNAIRIAPLYARPARRRDESPAHEDIRSSRADRRHRPYSERGRDSPRPGRQGAGPRVASPAPRRPHLPPQPSAPRAPAAARPPIDEDVDMEPVGAPTDHGPSTSAAVHPPAPRAPGGPRLPSSAKSGKRA